MGPLTFLRLLPPCVRGGAAAEPERLQAAVRAPTRAGVHRDRPRAASQLHLDASRRGGAPADLQRGALRQLRRPGADPQDGEPGGVCPAAGRPTGRPGAEAAHEAVWVRSPG